MKLRLALTILSGAVALGAGLSAAAADTGLCPVRAGGVPYWSPAYPQWRDFGGVPATAACTTSAPGVNGMVDCHHDDPRWRGATALTYNSASGSANPPVQFRAIWSSDGGSYLYLQWLVRVGTFGMPGQNHDLYVGFERPGAAGMPIGHKRAYMLKFHVAPAAAVPPAGLTNATPVFCTAATCDDDVDHYTLTESTQIDVASDPPPVPGPDLGTCPATFTGEGLKFKPRTADETWVSGSVQYQRSCPDPDGPGPATPACNLWVVSLRVPMVGVAGGTADVLPSGIEDTSKFWYQVDLKAAASTAKLDSWPRLADTDTENPVCFIPGTFPEYVQRDLDDTASWSQLHLWDGNILTRDDDCFDGLSLRPDDIGVLPRDVATAAPDDGTILDPLTTLQRDFKVFLGTAKATNLIVARPQNRSTVPIDNIKLKARFRLAQWGTQPWMATPPGTAVAAWSDIPGSGGSVCAAGSGGATCNNVPSIGAGLKTVIKFHWDIAGPDASISDLEALDLCEYGLSPPAPFGCGPCTTPEGRPGVLVTGGASGACRERHGDHQCLLVELDSDSAADIETQSVYKNMNVRQMSEVSREATISVRGLPPIPGATNEQIYLIVMPRNMPAALPGTTGQQFVQQGAEQARDRVMRPYVEAARDMDEARYEELADQIYGTGYGGLGYGGVTYGGVEPEILGWPSQKLQPGELPRGWKLMPLGIRGVANMFDALSHAPMTSEELTESALAAFDDVTATTILPTLDIYAFRKGKGATLIPMTSFTLVLHHEGAMYGMGWEIDGATKLSPNVFRVDMPLGHKRKINVRAMAKEQAGDKQSKGAPKWPCTSSGGICCRKPCDMSEPDYALSNTLPLLLVGVVLCARPRRKRKGKGKGNDSAQ